MIEPLIGGALVGFALGFVFGRYRKRRKVTVILDRRPPQG